MAGKGEGAPFEELSTGEVALGSLLDDSASLRPDELPEAVRRKAALVGLRHATLYLIDKDQSVLVPFPKTEGEVMRVDASLAGRAFRTSEVIISEGDDGGEQLWFPLLDGSDRVGVLGARAAGHDPVMLGRGRQLAALTAELLLAKGAFGDDILVASGHDNLSLAAEMRWALLPPLSFVGRDVTMAGYFVPAYDIAGDAFDYAINGQTAHAAIFDARGHGLTASRIANLAVSSYRHSRRTGLDLAEAYRAMNATIEEELGGEAFATAQVATLDVRDGAFRWVNAGHPQPLLLRGRRHVQELRGERGLPIGLDTLDGAQIEVNQTALEPGDVVVFYSDGITEARSPDGEQFGIDRLADFLVRAAASQEKPAETVRRLVHSVIDHAANEEANLSDDATVFLLGWRAWPTLT